MIFDEVGAREVVEPSAQLNEHAAAVAELFDEHARALLRYASSRLDPCSAQDIVSETFIVAMRQLPNLDSARSSPRAWLLAIASNLIRNHARGESRRQRLAATLSRLDPCALDEETRLIDRLDAQHRVRQLLLALEALSDGDREVLRLSAVGGLNASEIAQSLGIRAGTVRSRLHRARKQLRESAPNACDEATEGTEPRHV
jgi:RNA polymerase sigma factor (sigma-70 family)